MPASVSERWMQGPQRHVHWVCSYGWKAPKLGQACEKTHRAQKKSLFRCIGFNPKESSAVRESPARVIGSYGDEEMNHQRILRERCWRCCNAQEVAQGTEQT